MKDDKLKRIVDLKIAYTCIIMNLYLEKNIVINSIQKQCTLNESDKTSNIKNNNNWVSYHIQQIRFI